MCLCHQTGIIIWRDSKRKIQRVQCLLIFPLHVLCHGKYQPAIFQIRIIIQQASVGDFSQIRKIALTRHICQGIVTLVFSKVGKTLKVTLNPLPNLLVGINRRKLHIRHQHMDIGTAHLAFSIILRHRFIHVVIQVIFHREIARIASPIFPFLLHVLKPLMKHRICLFHILLHGIFQLRLQIFHVVILLRVKHFHQFHSFIKMMQINQHTSLHRHEQFIAGMQPHSLIHRIQRFQRFIKVEVIVRYVNEIV